MATAKAGETVSAIVGVGCDRAGQGCGNAGLDFDVQDRLAGLDSKWVVGNGALDSCCDGGLNRHGVDGDERTAQPVVLHQPG